MEPAKITSAQLRPIIFEGQALPRSVMMISALSPLAARKDMPLATWLRLFPQCRRVLRSAPSIDCFSLSGRASDLMLDHRSTILELIPSIPELLDQDPNKVYGEWITSLQRINELAARTEDDCEWHAPADPNESPILGQQLDAMKKYLDEAE